MQPGWVGYIGVDDVDATAGEITRLGGTVTMAPMDLPGVGRIALVSDPQGLSFYIMRGSSGEDSTAFHNTAHGHCGWNELVTTDVPAAFAFFGALFDWETSEAMPMGELGEYSFIDHHGTRIGAAMPSGGTFPTRWTYYFNVPSIEAAKDRLERAGGTVTQGPHEVPGGMHVIMATDPQGTAFALVGGK